MESGYFASSCGGAPISVIRQYIDNSKHLVRWKTAPYIPALKDGFYGTPDKKRHLTMARLELLLLTSNMVASVAMSSITCLIFRKPLAYFRYSGLYLRPDERLDNRFISRCINQLTFKIEASSMVRWPVAICVPATTNATGTLHRIAALLCWYLHR